MTDAGVYACGPDSSERSAEIPVKPSAMPQKPKQREQKCNWLFTVGMN